MNNNPSNVTKYNTEYTCWQKRNELIYVTLNPIFWRLYQRSILRKLMLKTSKYTVRLISKTVGKCRRGVESLHGSLCVPWGRLCFWVLGGNLPIGFIKFCHLQYGRPTQVTRSTSSTTWEKEKEREREYREAGSPRDKLLPILAKTRHDDAPGSQGKLITRARSTPSWITLGGVIINGYSWDRENFGKWSFLCGEIAVGIGRTLDTGRWRFGEKDARFLVLLRYRRGDYFMFSRSIFRFLILCFCFGSVSWICIYPI